MPLYNLLDFSPNSPRREPVYSPDEVPKDMDIFYRRIETFLPEGKTLADLNPQELAKIKSQYRFDIYRPGIYQGITAFANMV